MAQTMQLDIVSAEAAVFTGKVKLLIASGSAGELGIYPGHTALLTTLKPGQIRIILEDDKEEIFYMSGGVLEVQPTVTTILADTAARAVDLDEAAALAAQEEAQRKMLEQKSGMEYSHALDKLAEAAAQLKAIEMLRKQARK